MTTIKHKAVMLILSSPSGAGKTTLAKALLESDKKIKLSISVTTRPKRENEVHGKDYYFVTNKEYETMIEKNMFLEHAEVFGYYYGTPRKDTEKLLESGSDIIYDIDWQGALELMKYHREDVASIFILPPSMKILEQRLLKRNLDDKETINKRLACAKEEISKSSHYDYIIVNNEVSESLKQIKACLAAERAKKSRLFIEEILDHFK